jgi:hypothetical protein
MSRKEACCCCCPSKRRRRDVAATGLGVGECVVVADEEEELLESSVLGSKTPA